MGLPGAGKSTVLSAADGSGYKMQNYGTLMLEIAKEKCKITGRDSLRTLTPKEQSAVQEAVGKMLAKEKGKLLLDTHCSINTPSGYLPGLPYSLLKNWDVERLVLITAPIADIMARRQKDSTRTRDMQNEESLAEHERMNLAYLAAYSALSGAPATIIVNRNGGLDEARAKFLSLLK